MKNLVQLGGFIALLVITWYAQYSLDGQVYHNIFLTVVAAFLIFLFFSFFVRNVITPRISDVKQRYTFRKTVSAGRVLLFGLVLFGIWIENVQALLFAYGLVGAGIAVSLQDTMKNSLGGLLLMTQGLFKAGDRIEIDQLYGDVIDVGLFYTTILEIKEWVSGDQTTGRLVTIPNNIILNSAVKNYTKDNTILWDEINIPLTYDSNWKKAKEAITKLVAEKTAHYMELAQQDIALLSKKYYLSDREAAPVVYVAITDNWVNFYVRYVTQVRERRQAHSDISQAILDWIDQQSDVAIASETLQLLDG